MFIGDRLRALRDAKKFSQGEMEKRTGLLRVYVSRVENGHTIPSVATLEKFARAFEVPLYQLFVDVSELPELPPTRKSATEPKLWGSSGKDARRLAKFCQCFERMTESDRNLLILAAHRMQR